MYKKIDIDKIIDVYNVKKINVYSYLLYSYEVTKEI